MAQSVIPAPVSLRKTNSPAITIFGDDADRKFSKLIWGLVSDQTVRVLTIDDEEQLDSEAYNSAIVFVVVGDADQKNLSIANRLANMPGVVADIVAITAEPDIRKRLHILSAEFDAIFNAEIVSSPEFQKLFQHKLKKGIVRLSARFQDDEYQTFRDYMSVSADAYIVFDRNKRIFYSSDHFLRTFPGMEDRFTRGVPVHKLFEGMSAVVGLTSEDPRYQEAKSFWHTLQGQYEFEMKDGRHLRMTAVSLRDGHGTVVSITNITDYKRQEEALGRALAAEQEASSLQKQFISMVSHEFRTPLSIVDGNAQILQRRFADLSAEEIDRRLKTIRSAVSRTVSMMEAVLSSNLLRTGKIELRREWFDIRSVIRELSDEQSNLSRSHHIVISLDNIPERVFMDKKMMILVMTNLLSNAVKFSTQAPEIKISGACGDKEFSVVFEDNGVGIPQEEVGRIFERFYRATTSNGIAGSGVGLTLVHDLVRLHEGRVEVASQVGAGTKFSLFFPMPLEEAGENV